jgi:DNA-binding response OmpR family regulator
MSQNKEQHIMDQLKILVVESDLKAAMSLTTTLRQQGWSVILSGDAVMAQSVALKTKPDAVVLNAQVPGGGSAVLRRMRSSVHTAVIPVIAIVAPGGIQKQEMLSVGAQECIEQPVDESTVCAAIRKHLAQPPVVTEAPTEIIGNPERLAALKDTGLLDSAPDESLDELTQLAAKLVSVPTVLVSLVDKDRQFFKSQFGLAESLAASHQTPLSYSFCQWVVSDKAELAVSDAREHPTLRANFAVRDFGVTAYAGAPLFEKAGHSIGSFCAVDAKPRYWTEDELATLRDLAKVAEAFIIMKQERDRTFSETEILRRNQSFTSLMRAIGNGVSGVTSVLRRNKQRLTEAERSRFLSIIEQQSQYLVSAAS